MREPEAPQSRPSSPTVGASSAEVDTGPMPLLTRLNERGIRLLMGVDAAFLLLVMLATQVFRQGWNPAGWQTFSPSLYLLSYVATAALFVATYYFGGLYEREPRLAFPPVLPRVVRQSVAATGLYAIANLGLTSLAKELGAQIERALPMPFPNLIALFVLGSIGVATNRKLVHWVRYNREGPTRVVLVGAPDEVNVARKHIDVDADRAVVVASLGSPDELLVTVEETHATEVVLLSSRWFDTLYPRVLDRLEARTVNVLQRVTAKETMFGLERVRQIGGLPFVQLRSHTMQTSRAHFKRFTDLTLLVLSAPVLLVLVGLLAAYELLVVGRPILFWQERVGAEGRRFRMVKFRTMYPNAEEDGAPQLATQDDPRIVPACRWLRSTRLDELPQIYNVLRGDMSLVGPRPERPELTERFEQVIPGYSRRHELPPGITGLAQIHGRYHTDPEYKLGYDLQYLVNWSPTLDFEILARTIWVVLTRRL
ncbi:MAG TPA: sugar transferase [Nitriliruptorales bacterium]